MGSINEKNQRPKIWCYCPFKGTVSADEICLEVVWLKMPCWEHATLDSIFLKLSLYFFLWLRSHKRLMLKELYHEVETG